MAVEIYGRKYSRVRWYHPRTGEEIEVSCGYDFSLLAPASGFMTGGTRHSFLMLPSHYPESLFPTRDRITPDTWHLTKGNPEDPETIAPIENLHALYLAEKPRLVEAAVLRDKYLADKEAWETANPPPHRNHTLMLRPHRGSRYLQAPIPSTR